jgi:hypothetical protein
LEELGWLGSGRRQGQRRDHVVVLGTQAQDRPTGHQQLQPRAARQQVGQAWRGPKHMLEVVAQQQYLPILKLSSQRLKQRPVTGLAHAELQGDGRHNEFGVNDRRQVDEEGTVLQPCDQLRCDLKRESRLASPGWPSERCEAHVVARQQRDSLGDLPLASDRK